MGGQGWGCESSLVQTNARASFILSSQQSFPAPSVSRRRGRPHLYHDNAVPTASSRRNKRSVAAEARRQAAKRSSGGDGEAEVALEAAVASGDEAAVAEAPLALAVAGVAAADTPHGRGHITGYVKHFCSFYVDITGDNP